MNAPTADVDVDVIVACADYHTRQLDKWLETPKSYETYLHLWFKYCFPPNMGNHLAFLGYARPHFGGITQCSEILSRCIAQILIISLALPKIAKTLLNQMMNVILSVSVLHLTTILLCITTLSWYW